nr:unnamed protein product [Callosobruchus analis]
MGMQQSHKNISLVAGATN